MEPNFRLDPVTTPVVGSCFDPLVPTVDLDGLDRPDPPGGPPGTTEAEPGAFEVH